MITQSRLTLPIAAAACFLAITPVTAQPPAAAPLTAKARAAVLDSVRAILVRTYVDADTGRQIADYLAQRQRANAYDSLSDAARFAEAVVADLRSINHDKHLGLMLQRPGMGPHGGAGMGPGPRIVISGGPDQPRAAGPVAQPGTGPLPTPGASPVPAMAPGGPVIEVVAGTGDDAMTQMARRANFGLRKVEILDGNIGYLEVAGFDGAPGADAAIGDALRFLERTDAIIIDVRRNGGGSGEMSHMLFSHFLGAAPVPTIRVRDRSVGEDVTLTSIAAITGPRRTSVPLYVLTSNFSASAAEEFAFVLKNHKRATIVGARTAGAGHMNQIIDVGHGFRFSVSYTRVSDPVTGKEWEQVGVAPDIETPSSNALEVAHQHALRSVPPGSVRMRRPGGV